MTQIRGPGSRFEQAREILAQSEQSLAREESARLVAEKNASYVASELQRTEPPGGLPALLTDLKQRYSGVDWTRVEAVLTATPQEIAAAKEQMRALREIGSTYHSLLAELRAMRGDPAPEDTSFREAHSLVRWRREALELIGDVERGLEAAGVSPASAGFPTEALVEMKKLLIDEVRALARAHGSKVLENAPPKLADVGRGDSARRGWTEPSRTAWQSGGWSPAAWSPAEPKLDALPSSQRLGPADIESVDGAARVIADRLGQPGIEASIREASERALDKAAFARALGTYALLADEAARGVDYTINMRSWGAADNRQAYRARSYAAYGSERRQAASKRALALVLESALSGAGADPTARLTDAAVAELLREVGVSKDAARTWTPTLESIRALLEGEAFLPLRAISERAVDWARELAEPAETRAVVLDLTRSVVEGRFPEWRETNRASADQLAVLRPEQRAIWLGGDASIEHEIKDRSGNAVKLTTSEPRGFDMFWATKVGGPSHGFDAMTHCALALLTNARNDTVVVTDPRWPNHAGRTYLRLFSLAESKEPVLFLEGSHKDFPYPASKSDTEAALVLHAIEKAKRMKVPLALSGELRDTIERLGLKGSWKNEKYALAPALLIEAASTFGPHDHRQDRAEVRSMRLAQFFVDLA